jgi:alkylation response protein AidB-like acyl-CoA dehydrogenase
LRWPQGSGGLGDFSVAATVARESALTSVGGGIAISAHTDGFLPMLRLTPMGAELGEAIFDGSRIGCMALSEPTSGSDVTNCETRARRGGAGWVISGHKHYVSNFPAATDCVVFTRTGERGMLSDYTLFAVPTDAAGVSSRVHGTIGSRAAGTSVVTFDEVDVGEERLVGNLGSGLRLVLDFLRLERLWAVIAGTTLAELCFEIAFAFASTRRVGGIPLLEHQAIAHRLADMRVRLSATEAIAGELIGAAILGEVSATRAAEGKLFCAQSASMLADDAVQILGGRGYTDETPMAQLWNDIRVLRIGGGADEVLRELIGRTQAPGALAEHWMVSRVRDSAG